VVRTWAPATYGCAEQYGITVNLGQFTAQTDSKNPNFLMEIIDNYNGTDNYLLCSYNNVSSGPFVEHIAWQLDDPVKPH
jgi:hypothetical protein